LTVLDSQVPFLLGFKIRQSHFLKGPKNVKIHSQNRGPKRVQNRGPKTAEKSQKSPKTRGESRFFFAKNTNKGHHYHSANYFTANSNSELQSYSSRQLHLPGGGTTQCQLHLTAPIAPWEYPHDDRHFLPEPSTYQSPRLTSAPGMNTSHHTTAGPGNTIHNRWPPQIGQKSGSPGIHHQV
jgi:hypothetical protein